MDPKVGFIGCLATKLMESMLEQVRQKIITDGYEHWTCDKYQKEFQLPELFRCHLTVQKLLFTGASKFVINNVSFDVTTSQVIFDISVPKLYFGIGGATSGVSITALGMDLEAQVNGWVAFLEPRVTGAVVLEINDEGHLSASSIDINLELKNIMSMITMNAMETDYSEAANNFLRAKLPVLINNYVNKCKGAMEIGLMSIANPILAQMF